ncbi:MAG: hypothetical protein HYU66_02085, partial [Armatimonadetes bacterium]|nr:hypothetical protein [Armatimonadota bacterium]
MRLRARPSLFRALGRREPPEVVTISGRTYRQVEVLKHDSWAATARYADDDGHQVACKFGRRQPLLFLPAAWLGRRLARKEADLLRFLSDVDGLPAWSGPVYVDGRELDTVVAH